MCSVALVAVFFLSVALCYAVDIAIVEAVGDKLCPLDHHLFEMAPVSRITCADGCARNADCLGANFHEDSQTCIGCDAGSTVVSGSNESLPGWVFLGRAARYGQACSSSYECMLPNTECRDVICTCLPGFPFKQDSGSCLVGCDKYGTTYEVYENMMLKDFNEAVSNSVTNPQDCLEICSTMDTCLSVDHYPNLDQCWYNTRNAAQEPTSFVPPSFTTINHYNRNCA